MSKKMSRLDEITKYCFECQAEKKEMTEFCKTKCGKNKKISELNNQIKIMIDYIDEIQFVTGHCGIEECSGSTCVGCLRKFFKKKGKQK